MPRKKLARVSSPLIDIPAGPTTAPAQADERTAGPPAAGAAASIREPAAHALSPSN